MMVRIGRSSGPMTDQVVESEFTAQEIEVVKDVLGMVNKVTSNKEGWFVQVNEGPIVVPEVK